MVRNFSVMLVAFALALVAAGCATVEPWERGTLAKPHMALQPNPKSASMRTHTYVSREAASGGDATEGGGCGCQ